MSDEQKPQRPVPPSLARLQRGEIELLRKIKASLPILEDLLADTDIEDLVYRFYHQSYKAFWAQDETERIVEALRALAPEGAPLKNEWFMQIVSAGTGREFTREDNARWTEVTRPMVEAMFHAHYFLEQACRYGRELDEPPTTLPSGWAALLYLYGLR